MAQSNVDRILNMVQLCGGQDKRDKFVEIVKRSLPHHIKNKDRYVMIFEDVVKQKLSDAYVTDKKSILPCVFQAVKFGLDPDPAMGLIYFIPYKGKLTYQLGYKGMIQMARNSGMVQDVRAALVFEKDQFDYFEDEKGQHWLHRPSWKREKSKELLGYSVVTMSDGKNFIHTMDSEHIDDIKRMVLARQKGRATPWTDELAEPEMRKKTAIRRHMKTLPCSVEMNTAIEQEERVERGEMQQHKAAELDGIIDMMDVSEMVEDTTISADDSKNDEFLAAVAGDPGFVSSK